MTHPALSSTAISSKASNLGEMNAEFEEADEEFVEQLTISQIEVCLLNETDDETRFWSSQPDGSYEELGGELGEMAGGLQNSPDSPEVPCWARGGPHVKRNCPSRLKAVIAKSGGLSRSSRARPACSVVPRSPVICMCRRSVNWRCWHCTLGPYIQGRTGA